MKHNNSSFWLSKDFYEDQLDMLGNSPSKVINGNKDPMKLAGYRRAIGNFVNIVTGKDIPVRYTSTGDSYTDGTTVTISANLKDHDFDPAVGLALHEGSHIKLTDFGVLRNLTDWIQRKDDTMIALAEKHETIASRWEASDYAQMYVKDLLNIVEDRRIDAWVYENAPGYQGYYNALYDRYFNATIIDKGLKSDEFTSYDWDSYMFRVCNMTNPKRRLDVLNMKELWSILDLKNISRLQNTSQALDVAWELFVAIEACLPGLKKPKVKDNEGNGPEDTESQNEAGNGSGSQATGEAVPDDGSKADGDDAMSGKGGEEGGNEAPENLDLLSDGQKKQLDRAIDKQKQFQEGEVKKTSVTRKLKSQIQAMEDSGIEMKDVDYQYQNYGSDLINKKANVTIVRNLSTSLMDTVSCGMWRSWSLSSNKIAISDGIRKGIMLGKKLKIRSEERSTKFNRLRSGKIDKRMIANAGYGAEAIFEKIESFTFTPGIIHISIDNSGSMSGERFMNAMTTAVAIAKACDMIENMDCVISFRAGSYFGSGNYNSSGAAVVLIAYDSRKHGMSQIKTCFPRIMVSGSTPEGLCFDAIMKDILNASRGKDAYFVNMSDGAPYYMNYEGVMARKHTRSQINKMTKEGIKVISYFISGNYRASSTDTINFREMYGKEAQFIDTKKIMEVAKTMNSKFLEVK